MASVKQLISKKVANEGLRYIEKDPMINLSKLLNWAEKFVSREKHKGILKTIRQVIEEGNDNNWYQLIKRYFDELSPSTRQNFIINFLVNSALVGIPVQYRLMEEHNCSIPWAILIDPTSACNLKCDGCWAAEYDKTDSLSYNLLDRVIQEGKELGIYMYIYSGGEPLIRKDDLLRLAKEHEDCAFLSFTNATLVDDEFAKELASLGNFGLAISIEGFEEETDMRRGKGTYKKVIKAMDLLREKGVAFGFSTCSHKYNTQSIVTEEYVDFLIEKGCMFGWYFTYMPIGKGAITDLMVTPDQRKYMYYRVRELRAKKPIFLMDFWNDGEYVDGCIAGGRRYLHINANGDVEPCAFIHYSNINIKDVSLLEALQSPIFMEYRENQPFNQNHLRPCPLLDNPEKLEMMVNKSNAYSTQPIDKENVEDLVSKTRETAKNWALVADELWEQSLLDKDN